MVGTHWDSHRASLLGFIRTKPWDSALYMLSPQGVSAHLSHLVFQAASPNEAMSPCWGSWLRAAGPAAPGIPPSRVQKQPQEVGWGGGVASLSLP